jgi:hypothetical protein
MRKRREMFRGGTITFKRQICRLIFTAATCTPAATIALTARVTSVCLKLDGRRVIVAFRDQRNSRRPVPRPFGGHEPAGIIAGREVMAHPPSLQGTAGASPLMSPPTRP